MNTRVPLSRSTPPRLVWFLFSSVPVKPLTPASKLSPRASFVLVYSTSPDLRYAADFV